METAACFLFVAILILIVVALVMPDGRGVLITAVGLFALFCYWPIATAMPYYINVGVIIGGFFGMISASQQI